MKRVLLILSALLVATISGHATSGEDIYKAKCASCHVDRTPEDIKSGHGTPEFRAAASKLVAPPMEKIATRLKYAHPTKETFVGFVADYITNPSMEKALCGPGAIHRFKIMPPVGKTMSEEDRIKVSEWMYDNYTGTYQCKKKCKNCAKKSMKCASGKCGGGGKSGNL